MATVSGDITTGITLSGTLVAATAPVGQVVLGNAIEGQIVGGPKGETGDQGPQGDPGVVQAVVAGSNIDVDSTDPANPVVSVETLTVSDISDLTASATELNYTDGVTSAIQTQLDTKQALDSDLTAIAGLSPSNDDIIQRKSGAWTNRTPAQIKTDLSLSKSDVGLGNVDNTSDANKPVSTATQTALDGKVDENAPITGATKTKITYDAKGLVTAGTDATTADIADSTNKRYVTDAQLTVIGNTSGTNTGNQDLSGLVPKTTTVNGHALSSNVTVTKSDVGLGNVDNTSDSTKNSATSTLTNKRITRRVLSIASSATPTINTDNYDAVTITALATAITSMTTNLSGTPTDFQTLVIRIKDDGTGRSITWGSSFASRGATLPTTTVANKLLTVGFIYNAATSVWGCVASAQET